MKCLLPYTQCIGCFFTYLDLFVVSFHFKNCRRYVIDCFTRNSFFVWLRNAYCLISSSLNDSVPAFFCMLYLSICSIVACMLLSVLQQVIFLGMFVNLWLSYIQFIDWFFTCSDLYVVSFHLNDCSWYVIGWLTSSAFFKWLWNDYCFI